MTAALRLSTSAAPAAPRVAPISGTTPGQSRARQHFSGLNQMFKTLNMEQKSGWQNVSNTLNASQGRTGTHKIHPSNAFVTLNSVLLASGYGIIQDAPANISAPPVLPHLTVQSSAPAPSQGIRAAAFVLTLTCPGYNDAVQLLASPPAPVGKNTFPDNDFKPIGFLSLLPANTPVNIADQYASVFGTPEPGSQITLKLIATSDTGIRLAPLVLTGIVTLPTGQDG